jgi:copper homeostasis protein
MKKDIGFCKQRGCEGVVIGILNPDGSVDQGRTRKLVELAYPMEVTFHRAFDRVKDPYEALEEIIEAGCTRILTSGRKPTALEGAFLLRQMIEQANERICIMPGSGVRANNILEIAKQTRAWEFHSSARTEKPSQMEYFNPDMKEELKEPILNEEEVKNIMALLTEFIPA